MNKQTLSFHLLIAMMVLLVVPVSAQVIKGNVWTAESLPQQGHITGGPWTLQQRGASNAAPSAGYCINGVPQPNPGTERMSPYYFAFVTNSGKTMHGFFDYRPRNSNEAIVAATSTDFGQTWQFNQEVLELFYRNVRTPDERRGDMQAQLATARVGERRLQEIVARYGSHAVQAHSDALLTYSASLTSSALAQLPAAEAVFTDYLDDDGWGATDLPIRVHLSIREGRMRVDFTGSSPQSMGCLNTVEAVVDSAVFYVVRCLVGEHVPANQGCLEPIEIVVPEGSLLNPRASVYGGDPPLALGAAQHESRAVAAGNVETSQRIVDALFGALASVARERVPAASQGTMNNLTFGGYDERRGQPFAYYETMGGGMGARPGADVSQTADR